MIPTDELRLDTFVESYDDGDLDRAGVIVEHTGSTRTWTMRAIPDERGGLVFDRFEDDGNDAFSREALCAFVYCLEELHERGFDPDLGPLSPSAGHAPGETTYQEVTPEEFDDQDEDTDTDTPQAAEAPQPTDAAVSDGGAVSATQHAPGTLGPVSPETQCDDDVEVGDDISDLVDEDDKDEYEDEDADEDTVEACPNCDGTTIYARETKPANERWRCSGCGSTFADPVVRERKVAAGSTDDVDDDVDLPDERPQWLAGSPEEIVAQSKTYLPLDAVIEAVVQEDDIPNVARRLGRSTSDVRGTVLQPLGLLESDGELVDDETLDDRLAVISRWDDE